MVLGENVGAMVGKCRRGEFGARLACAQLFNKVPSYVFECRRLNYIYVGETLVERRGRCVEQWAILGKCNSFVQKLDVQLPWE